MNPAAALKTWWSERRAEPALPVRTAVVGAKPTRLNSFDGSLVFAVAALLALGLVMVYSASIALPESRRYAALASTHFVVRHAESIVLGALLGLAVTRVPVAFWERTAHWLLLASLALLVLVFVPVIGQDILGSRRWITLGFMNFQPSELTKLAMAMYAASYMVRKMDVRENFFKAVLPMAVAVAVVGGLVLCETDVGAFVVIAIIAMGILFLGGVNGRMFLLMTAVISVTAAAVIALSPNRRARVEAFLDPWANADGKGYQLVHSMMSFGRGELLGQGLGEGVGKLHYLPEAHTDFLLAVIGEELGLVGVAAVIVLFFWLVRRVFAIGRQAIALDRVFAGLLVQGIGVWIGAQACINMGVNLGLLPTKGLTLPFVNFGRSAIVMNLIAIAIVIRVDMESRALMRGGRP